MGIAFREIEEAYEFANSGSLGEHAAFLCRETGRIFYTSELGDSDELPDDIDDEKYIELPTKRDLGLGKELVMDFVAEHLPGDLSTVNAMFRKRGAYGRFKDHLQERGLLERWHEHEAKAQSAALRRWCGENDIEVGD